ncbi:hypothetical protein IU462_31000 [Nocardia farcinica]|nr:hypothetical protein [Nocardia farcinica]
MDGPSQIKRLRGGVLKYAAQATSQIDAEIGKKDHFWMETSFYPSGGERFSRGKRLIQTI